MEEFGNCLAGLAARKRANCRAGYGAIGLVSPGTVDGIDIDVLVVAEDM